MSKRVTTSIKEAVRLLKDGQLVAFPTETVYGLGADALNPLAVKRVYEAKSRPFDHPLIIHIGFESLLDEFAINIPSAARELAARFWPGPLTLVLDASDKVPRIVTGGQDTVAIRFPSHPVAIELLNEFGGGIVGPSANKFGRLSPTRAEDVARVFGSEVSLILDGGPCAVGIESTIIGFDGESPVMLRPGMIDRDNVSKQTSENVLSAGFKLPRVPGALPSHYAPRTKLRLLATGEIRQYVEQKAAAHRLALLTFQKYFVAGPNITTIIASQEPNDYAKNLYLRLRELDSFGAELIIVEAVPEMSSWDGIRDRLTRAAHLA
ncbi:MAG: L-threonylcarbamoyladenylate synthase [Proteobacteria bacterium]|nr:L-threonylcarbamoyladenylate synthase [Pseudomonadota bacterium]MDA1331566.1 L-threonylcarbamoyladenylate synthase [Pseudomonadota bacterium]